MSGKVIEETLKWPFKRKISHYWCCKNIFLSVTVGLSMRVLLRYLNSTKVHNWDILEKHIESGAPLITVSNHTSCLDDPGLFGLLRVKHLSDCKRMRWGLGAHDVMFKHKLLSWFFSHGKAIPIIRGAGVYQRAMDFALEQLNSGGWIHVFPEGKVNAAESLLRLKWGVGRLVDECHQLPMVLPFYHMGMHDMLPNQYPYYPRVSKHVTVMIGEPISLASLISRCYNESLSKMDRRKTITDEIQKKIEAMRPKVESLHKEFLTSKRSLIG